MKCTLMKRVFFAATVSVFALSCANVSQAASEKKVSVGAISLLTGSHLKVGAGNGDINLGSEVFASNIEGFSGTIHDAPHARVLVIEKGIKIAIVSLELVNTPEDAVTLCQNIVSEKTGTPTQNIWVHSTHAITTPHAPTAASERTAFISAITTAITEAATEAASSFQNATVGVGTGTLDVNSNRDILLGSPGSWYYGLNGSLYSNKTMTVLRFNSVATGNPIGFFISYGIKPTAIDNVEKNTNGRQVSSDVPGKACTDMEAHYGVPAMFCMPAAGDQIPKETTTYYTWDGSAAVLHEGTVAEGLAIVADLGQQMGVKAIDIADKITTSDISQKIGIAESSLATRDKADATDVTLAVGAISFGDVAFVGFKPELNAQTEKQLLDASPFAHTLLISFRNGDQKYMPDQDAYGTGNDGKGTWEAQRSGFKQGAAELFVAKAQSMLEALK